MNHLNSCLLEGVICTTPEYSENPKECIFYIESYRFVRTDNGIQKKTNVFTIFVTGKKAEACSKQKIGRGVRVVGRLDRNTDNSIYIDAENIEFRPETSGKGAK